jgi:uncharacterized protein YigE (DUF2233 family)
VPQQRSKPCPGWRIRPCSGPPAVKVYWCWPGAEHFPSEHILCAACADQCEQFLFALNGGRTPPCHYSRDQVEGD